MEQNMDSVKEEAKRPEDMGEETEKELPGEETTTGGETGQPEDAEGTESTEEQPEEFSDGENLEQLQADYNTLRTTYDTLTDKYLRLTVEYENFRKRSQREKEAVYPDAVAATGTPYSLPSTRFIPTSITTAPGFTISPVISSLRPTAATNISA